jgi:hypothetical protein
MSGYLQRLVDAAAGRGDAVHPRTGSIYAPRPAERHASLPRGEEGEETEHVTLRLTQPPPDAHAMPAEIDPPEPSRTAGPRFDQAPLLPRTVGSDRGATADAPPFVPLLSNSIDASDDPFDERSSPPAVEPQRRLPTAEGSAHITVTTAAAAGGNDPFRPVVKPAGMSGAVVSAAAPRGRPAEPHGVRAAPQPDDIQIHIGRIEVLAVPPPAPRAASAPDRSLSLDAYLNRRDGRTR